MSIEVVIKWKPEDIMVLRDEWTREQAEDFLSRNGRTLQDRSVELGWGILEDLMGFEE